MPRLTRAIFSGLLTVGLLAGLEGGARLAHWGPTYAEGVLAARGVSKKKKPGERRVFFFGGSQLVGYHHQGQSSVPGAWDYEARRRAPDRPTQIVNFGRPGEGVEFAVRTALDSLDHAPDVVFLFTGENEFVPTNILRGGLRFGVERLVLGTALGRGVWARVGREPVLSVPDFTRYSWNGVIETAESRHGSIRRSFRRRIAGLARRMPPGTVLVIVEPSLNMVWGPLWHDDLEKLWIDPEETGARFFVSGILAEEEGKWELAAAHHARAYERSPRFADAAFRCAGALDRLNRWQEANALYREALAAGPLPRHLLLPPGDPLRRTPGLVFLSALDLLARDHPRARVDFGQTEDDIHLRPQSEWALANRLVQLPEVSGVLGFRPSPGDWEGYRRAAGLDAEFEYRTALSVAKYHAGRTSAEPFLARAAALFPNRPDLAATARVHNNISTRRQGRVAWLTHMWRSRGYSSEATETPH